MSNELAQRELESFVGLGNGKFARLTVEAPTHTRYDYSSSTTIYTGVARIGTATSSTGWTITKYDLSSSANASGTIATDVSWDNRASGSYA